MKELYEELTKKNKLISTLNIELNEVRGLIEKKSFELKKEVEKNMEKSKQNEFSKR